MELPAWGGEEEEGEEKQRGGGGERNGSSYVMVGTFNLPVSWGGLQKFIIIPPPSPSCRAPPSLCALGRGGLHQFSIIPPPVTFCFGGGVPSI